MRIVQYDADGATACGIEVAGEVYATGYADTLSLIRDGERGLEQAAGRRPAPTRRERPHPRSPDEPRQDPRLGRQLPEPRRRGSRVRVSGRGRLGLHQAVDGDRRARRRDRHPPGGRRDPATARRPCTARRVRLCGRLRGRVRRRDRQAREERRRENALDHIFGYTVFNDVGSRSVQFHNSQRDLGKNFDTFCPMGPCIVTRDELPNWENIRVQSRVNGELRQDALVGEQIGPPPLAIEWLSSIITLEPGDCLMTGTPAGCGTFTNPPRFLNPGDTVTVSASGIGELTNPVVQGTARTKPRHD